MGCRGAILHTFFFGLCCCFLYVLTSTAISAPSLTGSDASLDALVSCLWRKGIHNFTTRLESSRYTSLLDYSLQNLRFTEAGVAKPGAIILPGTEGEVERAWGCMREGGWEARVRSGGHSYEGLSSTAGSWSTWRDAPPRFAILDLMNMNRVRISTAARTAWVEAGATIGELYYAIGKASRTLAFPAGTCPTVGVGGHVAGGGYGLLARRYGLSADHVLDARVVLPGGGARLLSSARSRDRDLLWALRGGGGGSWGIVVAWKLRLVAVPPSVTTFNVAVAGSRLSVARLVHFWQTAAPLSAPSRLTCGVYLAAAGSTPNSNTIAATFFGQNLGSINDTIATFSLILPELNITPSDCFQGSWIQAAAQSASISNPSDLKNRYESNKSFFKAKSDYVKSPLSIEALFEAFSILDQNPQGYMIFDAYGGEMAKISPSSIPFPHRARNLYSIQYQVVWQNDTLSNRNASFSWLTSLYNYMGTYVSYTFGSRSAYVNYIDLDLGNGSIAGPSYFGENFARLVKIKAKIDPMNLFNNPQSVPISL